MNAEYATQDFEQLVWEAHERRVWEAFKNTDGSATYGSWNAYVKAEFNLGKAHGYRLISFIETKELLAQKVSPGRLLPATEKQTRPLAKLPAEERPAAWAEAVERSGGGQPTARVVETVVEERTRPVGAEARGVPCPCPPLCRRRDGLWRRS